MKNPLELDTMMHRVVQASRQTLMWACLCLAPCIPRAETTPLQPCHLPRLTDAVQCGRLARPLDPADAAGRHIDIHYAVVPAKARGKRADPVYFFAGGPGQSAIDLIADVLGPLDRLSNRRDLVFIDQRGTGRSAPLKCPADPRAPLADQVDPARQQARLLRCRDVLQALPHGDLRHYATTVAMGDIDAVRTALGHDRINLIGASYGTRAALEYLRLYPSRVRRLVLDGVVPPGISLPASLADSAQRALDRVFDACRADAECTRRHPRLQAHWERLLQQPPATVAVADPWSGTREPIRIDASAIMSLVRMPLYLPALAAGLPQAIDEAAAGRWESLLGLASVATGRATDEIALGMHFSVICAEEPRAPSPPSPRNPFAAVLPATYATLCANWPKAPVEEGFYRAAMSPAPTLLLSGDDDPATPPELGDRLARALGPQARHIGVPHAGHGVLAQPCAARLLFDFIDAESDAEALKAETGCLMRLPRPPAYVPVRERLREPR